MKFENLKSVSSKIFRRITGVKPETFEKMAVIIKNAREEKIKKQKSPGGRRPKLSVENCILMTLEYLREYRTYAHIGASYGISEARAYENIRWIENVLIKSREFSLPGKKALLESENEFEIILIDATESPIERPKKNKNNFIQAKRSDIRLKHKS